MHSAVTFEDLDPVLTEWSTTRKMPLYTRYRDDDVRSYSWSGPNRSSQIWLDVVGDLTVHVSDNAGRRRKFPATAETLPDQLDTALELAKAWCSEDDTTTVVELPRRPKSAVVYAPASALLLL